VPALSFDTPVNGGEVAPPVYGLGSGLVSQTEILPGTVSEYCGTENYET